MNILYRSRKNGFTLVELLVVIAIIAILTGIIVTNLVSSKAKSRDARRASDLSQISLALEQYFDRCDQYPAPTAGNTIDATVLTESGCPVPGISLGNFISVLPSDPSGASSPLGQANYGYYVSGTPAVDYVLYTKFEGTNSVVAQSAANPSWFSAINCSNSSAFYYCVRPN